MHRLHCHICVGSAFHSSLGAAICTQLAQAISFVAVLHFTCVCLYVYMCVCVCVCPTVVSACGPPSTYIRGDASVRLHVVAGVTRTAGVGGRDVA